MRHSALVKKVQTGTPDKQEQEIAQAREMPAFGNQDFLKALEAGQGLKPDRGINKELPEQMRAKLEAHFGFDLSGVSFKESPEVPEIGAKAYAQGNVIKFAPGEFNPDTLAGRQMIGHELAHVVQQARGGIRANVAGSPVNYDEGLENMADREGARVAALSDNYTSPHSGAVPALPVINSAPIQGFWGIGKALKKFWGRLRGRENRGYGMLDQETFARATDAASTGKKGTVGSGLGAGKVLSSVGGGVVDFLNYTGTTNSTSVNSGFGAGSGTLGSLNSLLQAYTNAKELFSGQEKAGDKTLIGLNALSDLGRASSSGASNAINSSNLFGTMAEATKSVALPVAAVGALVTGTADMITGGVGAYKAGKRREELNQLYESSRNSGEKGIARFARDAQAGKQRQGIGKTITGAITTGGGLALGAGALGLLGAAATPVGWALLAGAGLAGAGLWAYNKYKRHQEAKKMLNDKGYMAELLRAGITPPEDEDVAQLPWYKRWFSSNSELKMDLIRGQVADKLARGNTPFNEQILSTLGFKREKDKNGVERTPNAKAIYRSLN